MTLAANPEPLTIPVILGSIRKGRRSHNAARLLVERVAEAGHLTQLVDLRELALPMFDEEESSEKHPAVAAFRQIDSRVPSQIVQEPKILFSLHFVIKCKI